MDFIDFVQFWTRCVTEGKEIGSIPANSLLAVLGALTAVYLWWQKRRGGVNQVSGVTWPDVVKRLAARLLVIGCVAAIVGWAPYSQYRNISIALNAATNSASVAINRPNLDPVLVIYPTGSNSFGYKFDIKNNGKSEAFDIQYQFARDDFAMIRASSPITNYLAIGSEMSLRFPDFGCCGYTNDFNCKIVFTYRAIAGGKEHDFRSIHRYSLSQVELKPGRFINEESSWASIKNQQQEASKMFGDTLALPKGTITTVMLPANTNLYEPFVISSGKRAFVFDRLSKIASFRLDMTNGHQIALVVTNVLEKPNGRHIISLIWNDSGAGLSVDGSRVAEPTNFWETRK